MKLTRLRLIGFKSFVEPTDFEIEPGLTGVVGPNGCGKSNLVEAVRWVMGEASYKAMRASEMDDVIFSGNTGRPARNHAEVAVSIDNSARKAPSAFNDSETLEVSRRIMREQGSTFRVNGREVRARDVTVLFADGQPVRLRTPAIEPRGCRAQKSASKQRHSRITVRNSPRRPHFGRRPSPTNTARSNMERYRYVLGHSRRLVCPSAAPLAGQADPLPLKSGGDELP